MARDRRLTGERLGAEAFNDLETRSQNAWKSDFQQKLARAKSYLPSTKPGTEEDREAVRDFIWHLKGLLTGRPAGPSRPWKKDIEQRGEGVLIPKAAIEEAAVDAIARLVRKGQKVWCVENDRQRAPRAVTEKLEDDSIKRIVMQWSLPPAMASKLPGLVRKYREQKRK